MMSCRLIRSFAVLPLAAALASCGTGKAGESSSAATSAAPAQAAIIPASAAFRTEKVAMLARPWAAAFVPGTSLLVVTEKAGTLKLIDTRSRKVTVIAGAPTVDFGGQGGLGDVALLESERAAELGSRTIYFSWAEAGTGDTRGAAVGKGMLVCEGEACRIDGLRVIWRQPKVTGRGHYSHRLTFSPDGKYLFVASGDRQKMEPAQDPSNNLGAIVRLNLDGTPAAGNPQARNPALAADIWSWGHRNILGLKFDGKGRLWDLEHGPAGGDELNLVEAGANYGWPRVSDGDHYDGRSIPRHATSTAYARPAISWNPVIAPGDFIFYRGDLFRTWQNQAIIAAMAPAGLVRVAIEGKTAKEVGRIAFERRIRVIVEAADGSIWLAEDGENAALMRLTPI